MACTCKDNDKYTMKLRDVIKHNDETFSFEFESSDIATWKEGDSSKLFLPVGDAPQGKKFSYATVSSEECIRFTTRIREEHSDYKASLANLSKGDIVEISAPSGNFNLLRDNRPVVLLSNGVGIAASRSIIKAFARDRANVPFVSQINVDAMGEIYHHEFRDIMDQLDNFSSRYAKHRKEFYQILDQEIQQLLNRYTVDPYLYVVGSNAFVKDTINYLKAVGFSDHDIKTDSHLSTESCGCSAEEACGCGGNEGVFPIDELAFVLPIAN